MPQRNLEMRLGEAAIEAAGISVANKTILGSAGVGAFAWFAQINWLGLISALVAIIGLLASLFFQYRKEKRERRITEADECRKREDERRKEEMHQAQLAAIKARCAK